MRYYHRTGKNSGVSVGPIGALILFALVCYPIGLVVGALGHVDWGVVGAVIAIVGGVAIFSIALCLGTRALVRSAWRHRPRRQPRVPPPPTDAFGDPL